jgi:hypothetical protein
MVEFARCDKSVVAEGGGKVRSVFLKPHATWLYNLQSQQLIKIILHGRVIYMVRICINANNLLQNLEEVNLLTEVKVASSQDFLERSVCGAIEVMSTLYHKRFSVTVPDVHSLELVD